MIRDFPHHNITFRRFHEKIILTGGGTAGHVTPNLALIPSLRELAMISAISAPIRAWNASLLKMQVFPMTAYLLVAAQVF